MASGTFCVVHKASFHFLIHGSFPSTRQALTHRGDFPGLLLLSGTLSRPPLLSTAPAHQHHTLLFSASARHKGPERPLLRAWEGLALGSLIPEPCDWHYPPHLTERETEAQRECEELDVSESSYSKVCGLLQTCFHKAAGPGSRQEKTFVISGCNQVTLPGIYRLVEFHYYFKQAYKKKRPE